MTIFSDLGKQLPIVYIQEIAKEVEQLKTAYFSEDIVKVGIHAGRFCELVSSLLCFQELGQKEDLNKISFDKNVNKLLNAPKPTPELETTTLLIPNILKAVYAIRSKKNIAHFKQCKPEKIDAKLVNNAVTWVIAQMLLIYCGIAPTEEILRFLEIAAQEDYPSIERMETGDILFNNPKLTSSDKLLFVLGESTNQCEISRSEIETKIQVGSHQSFINLINRLKGKKFIYETDKGLKLTKWGINELISVKAKLHN